MHYAGKEKKLSLKLNRLVYGLLFIQTSNTFFKINVYTNVDVFKRNLANYHSFDIAAIKISTPLSRLCIS